MAERALPTILIVDDEPDILDTHARLLSHGLPNVTVLRAANAEEGFEQLGLHPVDIVLSDLQMPGMDGMDFLAECQRMDSDVYRIILTAFPDAAEIHKARGEAQLEAILQKPVSPPALFEMLKSLLAERTSMGL